MKVPEEHFNDEIWSDYVRKVAAPADMSRMQAHLDAGCPRCALTVEVLTKFAAFAVAEAAQPVPAGWTAQARSIFAPAPAADSSWTDHLERIAAALIWEQQPGWLPQGVRSAAEAGQRILYRAGNYSVDLNVERSPGEPAEIIGQIANEQDPHELLEGILVQVLVTGRTVVETATNRFGEFIIEYPAARNPVLRLALRQRGQRIDLPLSGAGN